MLPRTEADQSRSYTSGVRLFCNGVAGPRHHTTGGGEILPGGPAERRGVTVNGREAIELGELGTGTGFQRMSRFVDYPERQR